MTREEHVDKIKEWMDETMGHASLSTEALYQLCKKISIASQAIQFYDGLVLSFCLQYVLQVRGELLMEMSTLFAQVEEYIDKVDDVQIKAMFWNI